MAGKKLAVIGGGPKAAALAAKAASLDMCNVSGFEVSIFEKSKDMMSNWIGGSGYSDGLRLLCTPPEKDVGFPYPDTGYLLQKAGLNPAGDLNKAMLAQFSWQAFQTERNGQRKGYMEWIDRKQPSPTHLKWADYLTWVLDKSVARAPKTVNTQFVEVGAIDFNVGRGTWILQDRAGKEISTDLFHLVITGSGEPGETLIEPRHLMSNPEAIGVFNGKNVWLQNNLRLLQDFQTTAGTGYDTDEVIGVLGGGGTGAAIAAALVESNNKAAVWMFNCKPMLHSRGQSYFETSLISDPDNGSPPWTDRTFEDRQEFIDRVDRGVISSQIMDTLESGYVIVTPLDFEKIEVTVPPSFEKTETAPPFQLWVIGKQSVYDDATFSTTIKGVRIPVKYFVDARGFNGWWFVDLIQDKALKQCLSDKLTRKILERTIRSNLSVNFSLNKADFAILGAGVKDPSGDIEKSWNLYSEVSGFLRNQTSHLYVPMVSGLAQGPGLPNLSSLGLMSNRILLG